MKFHLKGIGFRKSRLALLMVAFISLAHFQNCAPPTGGSGFGLNDQTTSGSTSSGNLTIGSILLSASQLNPGSTLSAAALVQGTASNVICQWQIINSANAVVGGGNSVSNAGSCSLTVLVPSTPGSFNLLLSVQDAQGRTASTFTTMQVLNGAPAAPTATANLTLSGPTATVGVPFGVTAQVFTSNAAASNVVIGYLSAGTKVPKCTFNNIASGGATPSCAITFPTAGATPLYVDVLGAAQNILISCQATSTNCQGTYSVTVNAAAATGVYNCLPVADAAHPIKIDFYMGRNFTTLKATCYFAITDFPGSTPTMINFFNFNSSQSPVAGVPPTDWSAIISPFPVTLAAGTRTFFLTSDDGSSLTVRNSSNTVRLALDNGLNTDHGQITVTGLVSVSAFSNPVHTLSLLYKQNGGDAYLQLRWQ
jgi:hypothetical protein